MNERLKELMEQVGIEFTYKASHYYGRRSPGWVAVVNGPPWHFIGRTGKKDAQTAILKALEYKA